MATIVTVTGEGAMIHADLRIALVFLLGFLPASIALAQTCSSSATTTVVGTPYARKFTDQSAPTTNALVGRVDFGSTDTGGGTTALVRLESYVSNLGPNNQGSVCPSACAFGTGVSTTSGISGAYAQTVFNGVNTASVTDTITNVSANPAFFGFRMTYPGYLNTFGTGKYHVDPSSLSFTFDTTLYRVYYRPVASQTVVSNNNRLAPGVAQAGYANGTELFSGTSYARIGATDTPFPTWYAEFVPQRPLAVGETATVTISYSSGINMANESMTLFGGYTCAAPSLDLAVTKTNTPLSGNSDLAGDTVAAGSTTVYRIVVSNNGPDDATGAIVTDTPGPGITCTSLACSASTSPASTCPTAANLTVANLQSGLAIPSIPNQGSVALDLTCTVN